MHTHEFELICDVEVCGFCYTEELMTSKIVFEKNPKYVVYYYNSDKHGMQEVYLTTKDWLKFLEEHPEQKPKWMK